MARCGRTLANEKMVVQRTEREHMHLRDNETNYIFHCSAGFKTILFREARKASAFGVRRSTRQTKRRKKLRRTRKNETTTASKRPKLTRKGAVTHQREKTMSIRRK